MHASPATIDGYHAATDYPSLWHPHLAPAWTDAVLRRHGIMPPRMPRASFELVDLGCGDGAFLLMLAAACPEGRFLGIDAKSSHIAAANQAAQTLRLRNISFRCARFDQVEMSGVGTADYVTAQGVLSWIGDQSRAAMWRLAARLLRPGGVLSLGYNCLPGWSAAASLQKLLYGLCRDGGADPAARIAEAVETIRAGGLVDPRLLAWFDDLWARMPRGYFAHEFLNRDWMPFWSEQVLETAAAHGLAFAGQADPVALRTDWTLRRAARAALADIAAPAARETAFDLCIGASFRTDIYVKGVPCIPDEGDAKSARLAGWWAACVGPDEASWSTITPAGTLRFDSQPARAILTTLADGPARLADVPADARADGPEALLDAADALILAGHIVPAEPPAFAPRAWAANRFAERRGFVARAGRNGVFASVASQGDAACRRFGIG